MINYELEKHIKRIDKIDALFDARDMDDVRSEEFANLETEVYQIEELISGSSFSAFATNGESHKITKLQEKINWMKDEYEFYDERSELAMMFPNGQDEEY